MTEEDPAAGGTRHVMDADGSNQTNLTNTPDVSEHDPTWQVP